MFTAAQLRAARGLLDWTRSDLAKASGLSQETIKNIEHGTYKPQEATIESISRTFASHNVEFLENEGVRLQQDSVMRFEGSEGFKRFLDDVYQVALDPSASTEGEKPICLSNVDDRLFMKHLGDYFVSHAKRMNRLENKVKVRILIQDRPFFKVQGETRETSYREYRRHPQQFIGNVPFYVYGDKLGVLVFEGPKAPQIVVISSALVAKAYREQFEVLWQTAEPLAEDEDPRQVNVAN